MTQGTSSENSESEGERPGASVQLPDKLSTRQFGNPMERLRSQPQHSSDRHRYMNPQSQQQQQQMELQQQPQSSPTPLSTSASAAASTALITVASSVVPPSAATPTRYVVEEETTTVRVPMLRPRLELLRVLRLSGASGETFTMGDIIHNVKEYIRERRLYDEQDPRIVHCGGDLLGEALGVESFTVHEAIGLFHRNCTLEPDSCIRIHRHLVTRPVNTEHQRTAGSGAAAYTTATQSSRTETTDVAPTSTSTLPLEIPHRNCAPDSTKLFQETDQVSSSVPSQDPQNSAGSGMSSSIPSSFSSQPSSSSSSSAVNNFKPASSSVTVTESDLERSQREQISASTTDSSSDGGAKARSRESARKRGGQKKSSTHMRQRSTSINVVYDEPDGACEVMMETSAGAMARPEDDTVVVEFDSDAFSVEYEVESEEEANASGRLQDEQGLSESDVSSSTSGTALLVVCKESDVEYLADYSDSDNSSDMELTDADKWECEYCSLRNPPFQRNCGGCWGVRPDWLPSSGKDSEGGSKDRSQDSEARMTVGSSADEANSSFLASPESAINSKLCCQEQVFEAEKGAKNIPEEEKASRCSPLKRKYSSCLSTSDSQEEKMKDFESKVVEDDGRTETPSEGPVKRGKKKVVTVSSSKDDPCVVCLTRKKTASIIHGKTGHQVCCYRCARRLKKQRKSCPICRRPIQKVIRNFHL